MQGRPAAMGRSPHRLALKRPPDHSTVAYGKLGKPAAREDTSFRYIKCVHNRDDVIAPGTSTLHILQEFARDQLMHVLAEIRGMQCYPALEIVEKKHG